MSKTLVTGSCIIFSGIRILTYEEQRDEYYYEDYMGNEKWIVESDEETKNRLISALLTVDITCDINDIIIGWVDVNDGTKFCKCKFYYEKILENDLIDIYIKGSGFDLISDQLEFTIKKIVE